MSESLPRQEETVNHFEPYGKEPPICCDECNKTYTTKSGYLYHCRTKHPERLQKCPECQKGFLGKRGIEIHHSNQHGEKLGKTRLSCAYCDSDFDRYNCNIREGMRAFCSRECMGQYNSENKIGEKGANWSGGDAELECTTCGDQYTVNKARAEESKYCSYKCRNIHWSKINTGENNPNWKGGHERKYGRNWQKIRLEVIIRDQSRCQSCGKTPMENGRGLSVHHIRRLVWFKEKYGEPDCYEKANETSNLVTLCMSCHSKWEDIPIRPQLKFTY